MFVNKELLFRSFIITNATIFHFGMPPTTSAILQRSLSYAGSVLPSLADVWWPVGTALDLALNLEFAAQIWAAAPDLALNSEFAAQIYVRCAPACANLGTAPHLNLNSVFEAQISVKCMVRTFCFRMF